MVVGELDLVQLQDRRGAGGIVWVDRVQMKSQAAHRANKAMATDRDWSVLDEGVSPLHWIAAFQIGFNGDAEDGPGSGIQPQIAMISGCDVVGLAPGDVETWPHPKNAAAGNATAGIDLPELLWAEVAPCWRFCSRGLNRAEDSR